MTSYEVDEQGVALLRLQRPKARNAIDTQMLVEMLEHLAVARGDEAVRVLVFSSTDHMGLSAGADIKEELDEEGKVRRMQLFADLYDRSSPSPSRRSPPATATSSAAAPRSPIACDMRVGGSNLRMRFPGAALGVPVGPARLVTLCGLAAAKYLLLSSRTVGADEALRLGLVNRVARPRRPRRRRWTLAAEVAAHPPEAVARLKRMLHEWDDVEGRSAQRGRRPGRVAQEPQAGLRRPRVLARPGRGRPPRLHRPGDRRFLRARALQRAPEQGCEPDRERRRGNGNARRAAG